MVWLKGVYPRLSGWIEKIPRRVGKPLVWVILVFMVCNMLVSGLALIRYNERSTTDQPAQSALGLFLDQHFPDERMERVYPSAKLVEDSGSG